MIDKTKILLCEDDESLGMLLREYLQAKGYDAELCTDGEAGYRAFVKEQYDICVLDVMMPKKDGFSLARDIKQTTPDMPIVFLTAKTLKEDVFEGFNIGADDYITKPFSMEELTLRIEAIMRRVHAKKQAAIVSFRMGSFSYDVKKQLLTRPGGEPQKLTTKESELLVLLYQHANDVLLRECALKTIWVDDNYFNARSMDVYITKLRKRIKDDPNVEIINVHGKGYKLVVPSLPSQSEE